MSIDEIPSTGPSTNVTEAAHRHTEPPSTEPSSTAAAVPAAAPAPAPRSTAGIGGMLGEGAAAQASKAVDPKRVVAMGAVRTAVADLRAEVVKLKNQAHYAAGVHALVQKLNNRIDQLEVALRGLA